MGDRLATWIEEQRPALALWVPIFYAFGIAAYFAAPAEPSPALAGALGAMAGLGFAALLWLPRMGKLLLLAAILPALEFVGGAVRARIVAAPVLAHEMTANLEGRVIGLDRSGSDRPRVLLDRVTIFGLEREATPARVRISLDPSTPLDDLRPGVRLLGQARLSPPAAPSEPGGFDYRRVAWFDRIGAIGYARTPMLETEGPDPGPFDQLAFRLRMAGSQHIQHQIGGQDGAFASAILTGDRSGIDRSVEAALRASSLYHIVSISGLHMTMLAAAIFAIVRYGLALVPRIALNVPLKKVAAVVALAGAAAYLVISGNDVAAQRSYIMTAVVLVAVLIDRPALTTRSIALAAFLILIVTPESLMQAGFQMSFAATAAMITAYESLRAQAWWQVTQTSPKWRFVKPVLGIAVTSLIAGTATAPISAFHFNAMTQYGLIANLLAVPAMGIFVMPAAVVAIAVTPLGLDWLPYQIVGFGMGYVIGVADFVAGLGGAVVGVPNGPPASLALFALGGVFLMLWRGRGRLAGLLPMALALVLWVKADRPEILVADNGRLFGIETAAGRVLSAPKGNGYAAQSWLENDGDRVSQADAYARGSLKRRRNRIEADVPGIGRLLYVGTTDAASAASDCAAARVLIAPRWETPPPGGCLFIGQERLRRDGALAIRITDDGLTVQGARTENTRRLWTRPGGDAKTSRPEKRTLKVADRAAGG